MASTGRTSMRISAPKVYSEARRVRRNWSRPAASLLSGDNLPRNRIDASSRNLLLMTLQQFRNSVLLDDPPSGLSLALLGLWWDAKGNWTKAHESAQQDEGVAGSWVHAYLHRKEGDSSNAGYWYRRAGKPPARNSLDEEWTEIVQSLIS